MALPPPPPTTHTTATTATTLLCAHDTVCAELLFVSWIFTHTLWSCTHVSMLLGPATERPLLSLSLAFVPSVALCRRFPCAVDMRVHPVTIVCVFVRQSFRHESCQFHFAQRWFVNAIKGLQVRQSFHNAEYYT
jgi:hypothetical protein